MKIGVLTSSRADYSIYFPLLKALETRSVFDVSILAFGTHVSVQHGYTINNIKADGFKISHAIESLPKDDSPQEIARSMGTTTQRFADIWKNSAFDLVFCLGDRYEMFAACAATIPFNIKLAHIHGGEETSGAIDNIFRHSITHMASYHFTAAAPYYQRVVGLTGSTKNVYDVGALSIDNLKNLALYDTKTFQEIFGINLDLPSILITFHPETVSFQENEQYINEFVSALNEIDNYQMIITMPNADTMGNLVRSKLNAFIQTTHRAVGVESFGTIGYLSCMKHCSFMLGNSSSGFIEASYFPKYVINIGDRQKGRLITQNIRNCKANKSEILAAIRDFKKTKLEARVGIYGDGNTSGKIVKILEDIT